MEKIILNSNEIINSISQNPASILTQNSLLWGAMAQRDAQQRLNEEIKEHQEEGGRQFNQSLFDSLSQDYINQLRNARSRMDPLSSQGRQIGQAETQILNILNRPQEPVNQEVNLPVDQNEEVNPPIDQNEEENSGGEDNENSQLVQRIVEQANPQRNEIGRFSRFVNGLINRSSELGITTSVLGTIGNLIYELWVHSDDGEGGMPVVGSGRNNITDPFLQPPQDGSMKEQPPEESENQWRQKWFDENPVPRHCQRRVYVDQNGILRSVVICESYESKRIYHDR